jgi:transposase InsO family protein
MSLDSSSGKMSFTSVNANAVPMLEESGTNWVTWRARILVALGARGLTRHIEGRAKRPDKLLYDGETDSWKYTDLARRVEMPSDKEVEAFEIRLDDWTLKESNVKSTLFNAVYESLVVELHGRDTSAEIWKAINERHQDKTEVFRAQTYRRLATMVCNSEADVKRYMTDAVKLREELAGMGRLMTGEEFNAIILSAMPTTYRPLLSSVIKSAEIAGKTLTSAELINYVKEEYDTTHPESPPENAALLAKTDKRKKKWKEKSGDNSKGDTSKDGKWKLRLKGKCWNCQKPGHKSDECWSKGGGKEGQGPNQKKEAANAATDANTSNGGTQTNHAFLSTLDVAAISVAMNGPTTNLIIDMGASRHFSPARELFKNYETINPIPITTADGHTFKAIGKGDVLVRLPNEQTSTPVVLRDTLYAPEMPATLVSVSRLDRAGYSLCVERGSCVIVAPNGDVIGRVPEVRGLYQFAALNIQEGEQAMIAARRMSLMDLHRLMGHISPEVARKMVNDGAVKGVELTDETETFCRICTHAKAHALPFPKDSVSTKPEAWGRRVHTDVWGPAKVESLRGMRYFVTFIDDYTREVHVFYMARKSEVFTKYKEFVAWATTHRVSQDHKGAVIAELQSDRGGEYLQKDFDEFLKTHGTVRRLTVHDSPNQNGIAERMNRTLVEHARALLLASSMPERVWAEALRHTAWLRNRTLTKGAPGTKTPHELATNMKPDLSILHEWGCTAYVLNLGVSKLESKVQEGRFVGYDTESKGYRVYWPTKWTVSIERNVVFDKGEILTEANGTDQLLIENQEPERGNARQEVTGTGTVNVTTKKETPPTSEFTAGEGGEEALSESLEDALEEEVDEDAPSVPQITAPTTTKRARQRRPPPPVPDNFERYRTRSVVKSGTSTEDGSGDGTGETAKIAIADDADELLAAMMAKSITVESAYAFTSIEGDAPSHDEALAGPERENWLKAKADELDKLKRFDVYEWVVRPPNVNVVDTRWVDVRKRDEFGNIDSYKSRVVARGFTQQYGIDYIDTTSPTAKLASLRMIMALAAREGWLLHQVDIRSAYLHAELDTTIYAKPPPGAEEADKEGRIWKLKKGLYGLKQSGRQWYLLLRRKFEEAQFKICRVDHCVFIWKDEMTGETSIAGVNVDDMLIAASGDAPMAYTKGILQKAFELKDLGPVRWLLGIRVEHDQAKRTVAISQTAAIEAVAERFRQASAKPCFAPLVQGMRLSPEDAPETAEEKVAMENVPYRAALGCVMYLTVGTRPDIAHTVTVLAQFLESPGHAHWEAVKRLIRYLYTTRHRQLIYGKERGTYTGYSDADWGQQWHGKSVCGYVFMMEGAPVSWGAKKQSIVAQSSTEAEYVALTYALKELLWGRMFFSEVGFKIDGPTILYCDNQGAIELAQNASFHARSKHINIRYHFIRDGVGKGYVQLSYIETAENLADIFTKALSRTRHAYLLDALGLVA